MAERDWNAVSTSRGAFAVHSIRVKLSDLQLEPHYGGSESEDSDDDEMRITISPRDRVNDGGFYYVQNNRLYEIPDLEDLASRPVEFLYGAVGRVEDPPKPSPIPPERLAAIRSLVKFKSKKVDKCYICQDSKPSGSGKLRLPCGHEPYDCCIHPWLEQNGTCPECRHDITKPHARSSVPQSGPSTATSSAPVSASPAPSREGQSAVPRPARTSTPPHLRQRPAQLPPPASVPSAPREGQSAVPSPARPSTPPHLRQRPARLPPPASVPSAPREGQSAVPSPAKPSTPPHLRQRPAQLPPPASVPSAPREGQSAVPSPARPATLPHLRQALARQPSAAACHATPPPDPPLAAVATNSALAASALVAQGPQLKEQLRLANEALDSAIRNEELAQQQLYAARAVRLRREDKVQDAQADVDAHAATTREFDRLSLSIIASRSSSSSQPSNMASQTRPSLPSREGQSAVPPSASPSTSSPRHEGQSAVSKPLLNKFGHVPNPATAARRANKEANKLKPKIMGPKTAAAEQRAKQYRWDHRNDADGEWYRR
ncbi:putative RING-type domain-containing protein [Seiridium cardinale]|uniref:RING-type domain-containing protein n=1 Tax=Seiridium cardinale TaxID=138064 RepID=A0ABR2Y398_9PEZI